MDILKKVFKYMFAYVAALSGLFCVTALVISALIVAAGMSSDEIDGVTPKTQHAVGVVELKEEIFSSENFRKEFQSLVNNERIKAIVVRIDSPGGAVGASEEIYRLIKNTTKKPVVCSMGTVAASGGLFAAAGCKKIVANESTLTGSIGVIMMSPSVYSFLDRWGIKMNVIKSGALKDAGSPFREVSTEDRAFLQSVIDATYQQFITVISQSRNIPLEAVKKFADGRVILGSQAKELGLVDVIGGLDEAARLALEETGDKSEPELIKPKKKQGLMSVLRDGVDGKIGNYLKGLARARLLYLSEF